MQKIVTIVLAICVLSLVFSTPELWSSQQQNNSQNGSLVIEKKTDGSWQKIGSVSFGKEYETRQFTIPAEKAGAETELRITRTGDFAAHIDALALGNVTPGAVSGADLHSTAALKKLAVSDYDVLDMGKQISVTFNTDRTSNNLSIRARIESPVYQILPFQSPAENLYKEINLNSAFHSYKLDSNIGGMQLDGDLNNENLKTPVFRTFARSGSGHPSGYYSGWVWNDDQSLYAAVDFMPDNTMDGDKDFCQLNVKTPEGVRSFRVSVPEQQWGKPGFGYTGRTQFQHKTYEFQIPFSELNSFNAVQDGNIDLAFTAYGTLAPPPPPVVDNFTEPPAGILLLAAPGGGTLTDVSPLSTAWMERDVLLPEPVTGEPNVMFVNPSSSELLVYDSPPGGGIGTAQIVWDGPDNNAYSISTLFTKDVSIYNRIEIKGVANSGINPVKISLTLHSNGGTETAQTGQQIILPAAPTQDLGWFFSELTKTPGFNPAFLNAIELVIDNTAYPAGASLNINEIAFSDTPLPVNLAAFSATLREEGVQLNWATAAEQDNLGFYVYRCENETDPYTKISSLIKGQGTTTSTSEYSFLDNSVEWGQVYRYKLVSVNAVTGAEEFGDEILVAADKSLITKNIPLSYALENNYPNPFNPGTTIRFAIPEDNFTRLTVYDVTGKTVKTLAQQTLSAGMHTYLWDGTDDSGNPVSTGTYFYELVAGDFHETRSMSLTK